MSGEPWISAEPRLADVVRTVLARALRRRRRVLGAALLLTAALTVQRALQDPRYEATLYFRLAEGDVTDPSQTPPPPRDIRQYITSVALSRQQLETIMRKYRVSTEWLANDRIAAIDDFRDDIDIGVSRNYFLYDRADDDAPRSAQVTVSLAGSDPADTAAMLHEIGDAILRDQAAQRRGGLADAREFMNAQLAQARARTKSLQETIDRLSRDAAAASPSEAIGIRAHVSRLEAETRGVIDQALALEVRAADVEFAGAAEDERLGLAFELFDESLATFAPRLTPSELALRAAIVFAVALLIAACAVGAFDDRIYGPDDLAAHGVPILGALPRFPGDDTGRPHVGLAGER